MCVGSPEKLSPELELMPVLCYNRGIRQHFVSFPTSPILNTEVSRSQIIRQLYTNQSCMMNYINHISSCIPVLFHKFVLYNHNQVPLTTSHYTSWFLSVYCLDQSEARIVACDLAKVTCLYHYTTFYAMQLYNDTLIYNGTQLYNVPLQQYTQNIPDIFK